MKFHLNITREFEITKIDVQWNRGARFQWSSRHLFAQSQQ